MGAPVYGLQALVNITFFSHCTEDADLGYFYVLSQSQIRIVPFPENPESNKVRPLFIDACQRIIMTTFAQVEGTHFMTIEPRFFNNGMFNR